MFAKAFKFDCIENPPISVYVLSVILLHCRHHHNIQSCKEQKIQTKVGDILDHLFSIKYGQGAMYITIRVKNNQI